MRRRSRDGFNWSGEVETSGPGIRSTFLSPPIAECMDHCCVVVHDDRASGDPSDPCRALARETGASPAVRGTDHASGRTPEFCPAPGSDETVSAHGSGIDIDGGRTTVAVIASRTTSKS